MMTDELDKNIAKILKNREYTPDFEGLKKFLEKENDDLSYKVFAWYRKNYSHI